MQTDFHMMRIQPLFTTENGCHDNRLFWNIYKTKNVAFSHSFSFINQK